MSGWAGRQDDIGDELADLEYRPPLTVTTDPVALLDHMVRDYAHSVCDHVETCDCSAGQAWRFLRDVYWIVIE